MTAPRPKLVGNQSLGPESPCRVCLESVHQALGLSGATNNDMDVICANIDRHQEITSDLAYPPDRFLDDMPFARPEKEQLLLELTCLAGDLSGSAAIFGAPTRL